MRLRKRGRAELPEGHQRVYRLVNPFQDDNYYVPTFTSADSHWARGYRTGLLTGYVHPKEYKFQSAMLVGSARPETVVAEMRAPSLQIRGRTLRWRLRCMEV